MKEQTGHKDLMVLVSLVTAPCGAQAALYIPPTVLEAIINGDWPRNCKSFFDN